jgi:hypothetical protein
MDDIEPYHWGDPVVVERTAKSLLAATLSWRQEMGRGNPFDKAEAQLAAALRFAGQSADGYVMARYLEDYGCWPADQKLVALLGMAAQFRDIALKELEQERRPLPEVPSLAIYPVGKFFNAGGTVYKVTGLLKGLPDPFYVVQTRSGSQYQVSHNAIDFHIKNNPPPTETW